MKTNFGEILTKLRSRANLTVQQLAERSTVPATLISGLQNNKRQIGESAARKLGAALGLADREMETFVYEAINNCTEKVMDAFKGFPAEILNLTAHHLYQNGISPEQVTRCVLKPKLANGSEPDAAILLNTGQTLLLELNMTTR